MLKTTLFSFLFLTICGVLLAQRKDSIDRQEVIARHDITIHKADTLSSITMGNGGFAFTVDITGLQTFYKDYENGVPLGTESDWGWHSFPNIHHYKRSQSYKYITQNGRQVAYSVQIKSPAEDKAAVDYFRINPHRLQLGNIGLVMLKKNGQRAKLNDLKNIHQHLNLWKGELVSKFILEGEPVIVYTYANQQKDGISFKIESKLLSEGRLFIRIAFPYPTGAFADKGTYFNDTSAQKSYFNSIANKKGYFVHQLDTTIYYLNTNWNSDVSIDSSRSNFFLLKPQNTDQFEFNGIFAQKKNLVKKNLEQIKNDNFLSWEKFWKEGGAIDFAGSKDKRAFELERRIILSEYLTRVQCAGNAPPQETGLTYNSWYGKEHLEMFWWHAAHFALWGHPELLEKGLNWYFTIENKAKALAERQGYKGVRWPKMVDNSGNESPSSVGAFLIWEQPHLIYLAELLYRDKKQKSILEKYKRLVFETADFMASFATYDSLIGKYNLGKGIIPAQECFNAIETYNPTYELSYWYWALNVAQEWRARLGMQKDQKWADILKNLAPLPQKDGLYLATQSTPDCYAPNSKYTVDHPAVLAALASFGASDGLDTAIMKRTFFEVKKVWHWNHTWGWDFPLVAMNATRLHLPDEAVDALFKKVTTNTYLPDGNNYQDSRLTIYLPGNGGLLSAIALMCAGFDGNTTPTPGFNKKHWKVKWEGLSPLP
ncbi:MAG TPA: hypothetical protein VFQ86_04525 [Arachidicoccus soli]|nr:hypothetical protein [Arachidicoccus soli]